MGKARKIIEDLKVFEQSSNSKELMDLKKKVEKTLPKYKKYLLGLIKPYLDNGAKMISGPDSVSVGMERNLPDEVMIDLGLEHPDNKSIDTIWLTIHFIIIEKELLNIKAEIYHLDRSGRIHPLSSWISNFDKTKEDFIKNVQKIVPEKSVKKALDIWINL